MQYKLFLYYKLVFDCYLDLLFVILSFIEWSFLHNNLVQRGGPRGRQMPPYPPPLIPLSATPRLLLSGVRIRSLAFKQAFIGRGDGLV